MNDVLAQNLEEAKSKAAKAIANTLKGKSVEDWEPEEKGIGNSGARKRCSKNPGGQSKDT